MAERKIVLNIGEYETAWKKQVYDTKKNTNEPPVQIDEPLR
jgi:hypothetical protein